MAQDASRPDGHTGSPRATDHHTAGHETAQGHHEAGHRHHEAGHRHHEAAQGHHETGHEDSHGGHGPVDHRHHAPSLNRQAVSATLHCLTGCAIGEVLGMVIASALGWSTVPAVVLAILLAFFFGYLLTVMSVRRAGLALGAAVGVAFAADTVSIAVMEIVDNVVIVAIPGAMEAGLTHWLFWAALALGLAVAFVVTVPVNRWMIRRGRGHAVAHEYHH